MCNPIISKPKPSPPPPPNNSPEGVVQDEKATDGSVGQSAKNGPTMPEVQQATSAAGGEDMDVD